MTKYTILHTRTNAMRAFQKNIYQQLNGENFAKSSISIAYKNAFLIYTDIDINIGNTEKFKNK